MTTRIGELPYEVDETRRRLRSRADETNPFQRLTVNAYDVRVLLDALDQWPEQVWPARAWVYGTWGYAVSQARAHAARHRQRVWVYAAQLDGESVWVASLDPRPGARRGPRRCGACRLGLLTHQPSDPQCELHVRRAA